MPCTITASRQSEGAFSSLNIYFCPYLGGCRPYATIPSDAPGTEACCLLASANAQRGGLCVLKLKGKRCVALQLPGCLMQSRA